MSILEREAELHRIKEAADRLQGQLQQISNLYQQKQAELVEARKKEAQGVSPEPVTPAE